MRLCSSVYVSSNPLSMTCEITTQHTYEHKRADVQQCRIKNRLNNISVFIKSTRSFLCVRACSLVPRMMLRIFQSNVDDRRTGGRLLCECTALETLFFGRPISHTRTHSHSHCDDCVVSRESKCVLLFRHPKWKCGFKIFTGREKNRSSHGAIICFRRHLGVVFGFFSAASGELMKFTFQ